MFDVEFVKVDEAELDRLGEVSFIMSTDDFLEILYLDRLVNLQYHLSEKGVLVVNDFSVTIM